MHSIEKVIPQTEQFPNFGDFPSNPTSKKSIRKNLRTIKAQLVYHFYKTALYDLENYKIGLNPVRFKKVVDKYFRVLENTNGQDYYKKARAIYQSFGEKETSLCASEDHIFNKIFPFNQLKLELTYQIRDTYRAMFEDLTKR